MSEQPLRERAGGLAEGAKMRVREGFDWSKAKIQDLKIADQAVDKTKETAADLYRRGGDAVGYVKEGAAARPFLTLTIAAAVGYGLGYLARRR